MTRNRIDLAAALACGGVSLAVYLRTLCPTVFLGDSGEICLAIAAGGVVHPPGYPLFTLLGQAALWLVPGGEPAWRIGCLVGLAAAAANMLAFCLARELGIRRELAAGAALFHAFGYTFWSQSVRVEVYSLHVFLAAAALLAALRYRRSGSSRCLLACALAFSLGMAHHLTTALSAPALVVLVLPRLLRAPGRGRELARAVTCLIPGPLLYGVLVLRAQANPTHAWGAPDSFSRLLNHVTGRIYQERLGPDPELAAHRAAELVAVLRDHFGAAGLLLPLAGLVLLARRSEDGSGRPVAAAAAITLAIVIAYNFCYRIGDIVPYYLLPLLWLTLLGAVASEWLCSRLGGLRAVGVALAVGLPAVAVVRNWTACDLSTAVWVREFARQKLEHCDPGAVLISHEDTDTFPIWYVRNLLHLRPDVQPIDFGLLRYSYSGFRREPSGWYLRQLASEGLPVVPDDRLEPGLRERRQEDGGLLELLRGPLKERTVYTTFVGTTAQGGVEFWKQAREHYEFFPVGILVALLPRERPVPVAALTARSVRLWQAVTLPPVGGTRLDQELTPGYVLGHYATMLNNLAGLLEMAGDRTGAAATYRRLLSWDPSNDQARRALAALERAGGG